MGCAVNPVTQRRELRLVDERQEIGLGHQTHPNVIFMYDGEYHDAELNRYLGTIVMRLHRASHRAGMPMEFTMLNTSVVNAFATPAHVYATRGFLSKLENEAQFAAVMGHELAHVAAGHTAKQLSQNMVVSIALGMADAVAGDSLGASLATSAGQVGVTLLGLSYSREQERQADRVGTYYMALAGWDPRQAIRMQRLLESLNERDESVLDKYLSTHPEGGNRREEINSVITEKHLMTGYIQGDGVFAERWHRRLARLRDVNNAFQPYDEGQKHLKKGRYAEALSAAERAIRLRDDQAPFFRLKGDALTELRRYNEAEDAYEKALSLDGRYVPANIGLGNLYLKTGQNAKAERQFAIASRGWPDAVVNRYALGIAREAQGNFKGAVAPLQDAAEALPNSPEVHYALAVAYDNSKQPSLAYASYTHALATGLSGTRKQHAQRRARALAP